jgi:hypothetical protein
MHCKLYIKHGLDLFTCFMIWIYIAKSYEKQFENNKTRSCNKTANPSTLYVVSMLYTLIKQAFISQSERALDCIYVINDVTCRVGVVNQLFSPGQLFSPSVKSTCELSVV